MLRWAGCSGFVPEGNTENQDKDFWYTEHIYLGSTMPQIMHSLVLWFLSTTYKVQFYFII